MSRDYQVFVVPPVFWQTKENMHIILRVRSGRKRYHRYVRIGFLELYGWSEKPWYWFISMEWLVLMSWYFLLLNSRETCHFIPIILSSGHTPQPLLQLLLMEELPFINQYCNYQKELINEYNFNAYIISFAAIQLVVWFSIWAILAG